MARFVTNMVRTECVDRFKDDKKLLVSGSLTNVNNEDIENSVLNSFGALKELLSHNTIHMERQPNSENNLYLKLMERA